MVSVTVALDCDLEMWIRGYPDEEVKTHAPAPALNRWATCLNRKVEEIMEKHASERKVSL